MGEKGRKRHTKCPTAAQLSSALSLDSQGQTNEHSLLLSSFLFFHVVTHMHHCVYAHSQKVNHASGCHACKRPVHTTVCCGYWTCTDPCFHWPVSPCNTLPQLQSSLIISCLLSVSLSPFLQQHQCACDKGLESSFKSRSLWVWDEDRHKKRV